MRQTRLIHSFPRPRAGDSPEIAQERAISVLAQIRKMGFVLAPELIEWDLSAIGSNKAPLQILQRRLCFTEIEPAELVNHSASFGPIALAFDTDKLRDAGAMPVIYAPQGLSSGLSQIAVCCVNGIRHTKAVNSLLHQLKELSDPNIVAKTHGCLAQPDYTLDLKNTGSDGDVVSSCSIPATQMRQLLQYVGFNKIPFDHSIGVLEVFLNMFCPTDNMHSGEVLGYYRQKEWRIIAGNIKFNGRPMGRELLTSEKDELVSIDPVFWERALLVEGKERPRKELALIYDPFEGWDAFDLVEAIYAPETLHARIREIFGDGVPIKSHP